METVPNRDTSDAEDDKKSTYGYPELLLSQGEISKQALLETMACRKAAHTVLDRELTLSINVTQRKEFMD